MTDNVTRLVKEQLMKDIQELGLLFIKNNWRLLHDTSDGTMSIENWSLRLFTTHPENNVFKYDSPRKKGFPVKDFQLQFDMVTGRLGNLEGEATLTDVAAIMQGILTFAKKVDQKEKESMTGKSFDEEVAEHRKNEIKKLDNCIADMSLQDIISWLGTYWGRTPTDGMGNFGIVTSRNTTMFNEEFVDHAREVILAHLARLGQRDIAEEPNADKEARLVSQLKSMSDKDLAIWFRKFQFQVGPNYLSLQSPTGNLLNYEVPYWPAFGREIAARLEAPRVTDDMLVIDLGKERPVNPLTAVKRFTNALEKVIQEGPEEPDLRAYGTERQIAQGWIDWYRKTHACGFDVAWTEGARRLIEKEYANRPEELKKITWYPRPHNPLFIDIGTKLEFIQP